ncbi:MbtH family NRPS accessory protein [Kribbella sp. CA-294648]|uniref:MbtH family NRPS accessory protein n=1 Tax=Kribbella sp. CA-294648 TaxID=3239948 RepID=UPI003D8F20BC
MANPFEKEDGDYLVLANDLGRYSLWSAQFLRRSPNRLVQRAVFNARGHLRAPGQPLPRCSRARIRRYPPLVP